MYYISGDNAVSNSQQLINVAAGYIKTETLLSRESKVTALSLLTGYHGYTFVSLLLRMSSYQQAGLTLANLKLPLNMLFALTEGERIVSKRDSKLPLYTGRPDHHISAHPPRRGLHIL